MKFPNYEIRPRLALALVLAAAFYAAGCAMQNAPVRAGAVSKLDSQAYDTLLIAQEVIAQAKASLEAGTLPAEAKPVVNGAVASYNTARAAWLGYRALAQSGHAPDGAMAGADPAKAVADLERAINELIAAIAAIPKLKGAQP